MYIEKEEEPFLFAFFLFKFCNQVRKRINGKELSVKFYKLQVIKLINPLVYPKSPD